MHDAMSDKDACQLCVPIKQTQYCCFLNVPHINLANSFIPISGCVSLFMMMSVPNQEGETNVQEKIDTLPPSGC